MNVEIDYIIKDLNLGSVSDIISADDGDLHYYLFLGDIILKNDSVDFSTNWGSVPVFDFVICIRSILASLTDAQSEVFEFTESDESVNCILTNDLVRITCSYMPGTIIVSLLNMRENVDNLLNKLVRELTSKVPELAKNEAFLSEIKNRK